MKSYYIEPLGVHHKKLFKDFRVTEGDSPDYFNKYLIRHSLADQANGKAKTYLYIQQDEQGNKSILGFYSLRASSLVVETDDFVKIGEPAIEIYELAVKKSKQRTGIGTLLMKDIIATVFKASQLIGVKYILVCAKHDAVSYYTRHKFSKLPSHKEIPRTDANSPCVAMYLSIITKD